MESKSSNFVHDIGLGLHSTFCHKNENIDYIQPYNKDGQLVSQVAIIKRKCADITIEEGSNKVRTVGQWLLACEPDFVERLDVGLNFVTKFVYLNPYDLLISEIEGFMPVKLISNSVDAMFIAVPHEDLQAGILGLHEEGLAEDFPISKDVSLVQVKKVEDVRLAHELLLEESLSDKMEELTTYQNLKRTYNCTNALGNPFLLSHKSESKIKLKDTENCDKIIKVSAIDGMGFSLADATEKQRKSDCVTLSTPRSIQNESSLEDSPHSTIDKLGNKIACLELSCIVDSTENENIYNSNSVRCGRAANNFSPENESEVNNIIARNESYINNMCTESKSEANNLEKKENTTNNRILTSTPVKKERNATPKSKSVKRQKTKRKSKATPTFQEMFQESQINYWLSNETKIRVGASCITQSVNQEETKHRMFKSNFAYASLRAIIEKKMNTYKAGKNCRFSWSGILLSGLPGTGKNLAIQELSSDLGVPVFTVSILGWSKSASPNYINDCFDQATKSAPSILVFDELESLCLCREDFCNKILKVFHKSKIGATPVILIGITNRQAAVPECLKRRGRFDREIIMDIPDKNERTMILLSQQNDLKQDELISVQERALGFTGADLDTAVRIGWQKAVKKYKTKIDNSTDANSQTNENETHSISLQLEDLQEGVDAVVPSFLRQNFSAIPKVCWSDIWGYDSIKEKLKKLVGESNLKGILLYGPPGCAKTMLVRALATETRFTFFPVKCSDLLSKFVGETEKCLCRLFETALQSAPSLIFMDEIDSLCAERSGGVTDGGIVSELLTILRKCSTKGKILVVGATNRPQAVDQALLSSGYLNVLLHVSLPDCVARCSIWNGLLKHIPVHDINVPELCSKTAGFSCAEICNVYQRGIQDLLELLHSGRVEIHELKLSGEIISKILSSMSPRTPQSVLSDIEYFERRRLNS